MPDHKQPFYIPIMTERNKVTIKTLEPGVIAVIDVINSEMPYDRSVAKVWIDVDQEGGGSSIIWFEPDGGCDKLKFGEVEHVRKLVEASKTVV